MVMGRRKRRRRRKTRKRRTNSALFNPLVVSPRFIQSIRVSLFAHFFSIKIKQIN